MKFLLNFEKNNYNYENLLNFEKKILKNLINFNFDFKHY